jgi:hypothetical protein
VIFRKPFEEIVQTDLEALIGLSETQELEFKKEPFERNDEGTREMLRDVASFANASGGYIIVGIETGSDSQAINMVGVSNGEGETRRITDSCLANIGERILGLKARPVPLTDGRFIILIHAPRSTRAPHMITFRGLNQFWKRYGTMKSKMSVEEIKDTCRITMDLRKTLEEFLVERRSKILSRARGRPFMSISATPLIVRDEVIDIFDRELRDLIRNPPYERGGGWSIGGWQDIRPSLYGLTASGRSPDSVELEVFRNAHVELRLLIDGRFIRERWTNNGSESPLLYPFSVIEYPISFLHFVNKVYSTHGQIDPCVIQFGLYNIKGYGLTEGLRPERIVSPPNFWSEEHLEIPAYQASIPLDVERTAKSLADRLWNAFGFEKAPLFDREGRFQPETGS